MKSLLKSFLYAFEGIKLCIKGERNFRIHTVATIYVLLFSLFYDFSKTEYALLLITIILVMFAEMVNTAVEYTVDLETQSYNLLAKNAKDVAAGAVFLTSVGAVIMGVILFFDIEKFKEILNFFLDKPLILAIFIASFIPAVLYIRGRKK